MWYLLSILLWAVAVTVVDIIFAAPVYGLSVWQVILYVAVSVVSVIAIDGVFATVVRWVLPKKWFSVDKAFFAAGRKECRFYEKFGIKKWKDKILELGMFTAFSKSKIADPSNNEYVARYITEANYGIGVHIACSIFGFTVCFVFLKYWYFIGIPVAIVNLIYNNLSMHILRYNLPKLRTLYRINQKREARKKAADSGEENRKTA